MGLFMLHILLLAACIETNNKVSQYLNYSVKSRMDLVKQPSVQP